MIIEKMKARTKEEILEAYTYEIEEEFTRCLDKQHYEPDEIEKILGDMYEEINAWVL